MSGEFYSDGWLTIWQGDALETLRTLPAECVDTIVTSPPYYGLRDYGTATWQGGDPECDHQRAFTPRAERPNSGRSNIGKGGAYNDEQDRGALAYRGSCGKCGATRTDAQLGMEATPEEYVARLVEILREARRALKPHGSLWLNIGDSYASSGGHAAAGGTSQRAGRSNLTQQNRGSYSTVTDGIKAKDLIGIPWMVAFALRADGWYLRRDVIWDKPNGMPESVTDRPTSSHEYVFLLTKSGDYFYDSHAVREPLTSSPSDLRKIAEGRARIGGKHVASDDRKLAANGASHIGRTRGVGDAVVAAAMLAGEQPEGGRNLRSVWKIATRPYPGAHYAVFPETLPERCIQLTSSAKGVCPECGAPWWRQPLQTDAWAPGCGCGWGGKPDDLELLASPLRRSVDDDRTYRDTTGRRGLDRERQEGEGVWLVTRYQQRDIARQLREWNPERTLDAMLELEGFLHLEPDEGDEEPPGMATWRHYIRTDANGARVPPRELLETWEQRGWLVIPEPPDTSGAPEPVPAVVLDLFAGSGTVGKVANRLSRRAILIDLNGEYLKQQMQRNAQVPMGLEVG